MNSIRSRKLIILVLIVFPFLVCSMPMEMCNPGDVRVESSEFSYLQLCVRHENKSAWAYICGDTDEKPWSYDNAYVWCRTRRALLSESSRGSLGDPNDSPELKLENVSCNRTLDANIKDCAFSPTRGTCRYIHGVNCNFCNGDSDCNAPGICNMEASQCLCSLSCLNEGFCDVGRCQCVYPFYGESCQHKHCIGGCLNGGECSLDGTCQCQPDNYGDMCEFTNCNPECQNNGICHSTGECDCPEPFHGDYCQLVRCTTSCLNNGVCLDNGTCQCQPPFYGSLCGYKTCPNPCDNDGSCLVNGTCQCQFPFYGEACQFKLCENPCGNDGICQSNGTCKCSSSFYGNACLSKFCVNPCSNDGVCLANGTCHCKPSFYGVACELKSCAAACLNGGMCNSSTGVCDCISPYGGPTCDGIAICADCEFVLSSDNMLTLIIVGASVGISVLLILIFITSFCLIKVARKSTVTQPQPIELSLRELPKLPEEPLYEYLDGDLCQAGCGAGGNQSEFFPSNLYEYCHFPRGYPGNSRTERLDSMELTYDSADANGYEVPLPFSKINTSHRWRLERNKDQLSESYVKMYPTASCPSLL